MHSRNPLLDELAKLAAAAAGTVSGVRGEVEARIRDRLERTLTDLDVVPREEFDAVREMAVNTRASNEALEARVAALEAKLAENK